MRILIISRNTFPHQSPRGFRTAELSEELVRLGHEVIVYSITGKYDYTHYMSETGVQIKGIPTMFDKNANDKSRRLNVLDRILLRLFSRSLFFPDIELMYRVPTIIAKEKDIDLLITIAFPHTIHWGAAVYKKKHSDKFPHVWVSDCGDPFFLNPFFKAPKCFKKYEILSCRLTDYITIPTKEAIDGYFKEFHDKIRIIPQGFDFCKTPADKYESNEVVTFAFAGAVYDGKRDPRPFMDYLLHSGLEYKFIMYLRSPLEERFVTESNSRIEYRLNYKRRDIIWECGRADFLINVTNPTVVQSPSKLIDYGITGRPVLDISTLFDEADKQRFINFCNGDYSDAHHINVENYRIERIAKGFIALAEERLEKSFNKRL